MPIQTILGVEKARPIFTVHKDTDKKEVHIYYGGVLFEIVQDKKDDPERLVQALSGQGAKKKLTSEIVSFIIH